MKKIILFDTSSGTLNSGDFIINECLENEMGFLFKNQIIARYSTHTPISRLYQTIRKNSIYKACNTADYKFLCGTNLFMTSLLRISPNWNINYSSCEYYRGSISIGCGMLMNAKKSDFYTRGIYKAILNKDYIHSVRDNRTKDFLESMGLHAINTGCPTLWGLTPALCASIPEKKTNSVVFTLTDYCKDPKQDKLLIDILRRSYKKLYFWVQGYDDYDYIKQLTDIHDIVILPHDLNSYKNVLESEDVDYVGTRLHAGIYAMRHGVRSIILSVDNRTVDMKETYNLPIVDRSEIETELEKIIELPFATDITIPLEAINTWKQQFK